MRLLLKGVLSRRREEADRLLIGPDGGTCHVCKRYRPDERISVYSRSRNVNGVWVRTAVRYCNDRASCVEGAPNVIFLKGETDA